MTRYILGAVTAVLLIAIAIFQTTTLNRIYLPTGTGILAKQLCSMVFVSRLETDYAREIYLDPLLGGAGSVITTDVRLEDGEIRTALFGFLYAQRAVYREGLGCTLVHGGREFDPELSLPARQAFQPMDVDTAHRDANFDTQALDAAIAGAFDDPAEDIRNTLGVAILHQGRLVGEHYGPGASRETPFLGWSMTKSMTATLAGVLVEDGRIDLQAAGAVPALSALGRDDITLDQLLRMTGGLALHELNNGTDPTSDMLFTESDMIAFAASRDRIAAPGDHWEYMSGQTNLAMSALQAEFGSDLASQLTGIRSALFEPLGIYSAIIEPDESGLLVGSSYMYATAQDWARLAQLYLDGGQAGGEQIIPANWAEIAASETAGSDGQYGLAFWLPSEQDGLPEGTFFMNGFQSQLALIIPSEDLVIVRFGATNGVSDRTFELARNVIAARQ
ncbi:MAG: serine hydrolase [Alphaproteobacteria bacterium]|nr:serine hydrolase [Alphaproteobacteria bacterium]